MEFSEKLRALMGERGIGTRELGRRAFRDKAYISRLANGKQRPSPEVARDLDEILGATGELSALAPSRSPDLVQLHGVSLNLVLPEPVLADLANPDATEEGVHVERRTFATAALGLMAGAFAPAIPPPPSVAAADVRALRLAASELWAQDRAVGGSSVLRRATRQYASARAMLDRSSISDPELAPRNRAFYQARMAWALAAAGDRDGAVSEGMQVLPALEGPVRSARTVSQLRPVRRAAPRDSEFAARFDALAARV